MSFFCSCISIEFQDSASAANRRTHKTIFMVVIDKQFPFNGLYRVQKKTVFCALCYTFPSSFVFFCCVYFHLRYKTSAQRSIGNCEMSCNIFRISSLWFLFFFSSVFLYLLLWLISTWNFNEMQKKYFAHDIKPKHGCDRGGNWKGSMTRGNVPVRNVLANQKKNNRKMKTRRKKILLFNFYMYTCCVNSTIYLFSIEIIWKIEQSSNHSTSDKFERKTF